MRKRLTAFALAAAALLGALAVAAGPEDSGRTYTVKAGEDVYSVAARLGVQPDDLKVLNNLTLISLDVGQVLKIPRGAKVPPAAPTGQTHTVKEREDLFAVAILWGVSPSDLKELNNLKSNDVRVGQVLRIPNGGALADAKPEQVVVLPEQVTVLQAQVPRPATYTVKEGEDVYAVCIRWEVSPAALKKLNNLSSSELTAGQVLKLPRGAGEQDVDVEDTGQTYTVQEGEDVYAVGIRWGVAPADLLELNNLKSAKLQAGQVLKLPREGYQANVNPEQAAAPEDTGEKTHTVKAGEDLYVVAILWGVAPSALKELNNLKSHKLQAGQVLKIPPLGMPPL